MTVYDTLSPATERMTRTERRRLETRASLLDAVIDLLLEQQDSRLSSTDIAEAADVAVGTFYNHFLSVDEAIDATFAHLVPNFADGAAKALMHEDRAVGFGHMMGFFMCRLNEASRVWRAARVAGWEISPIGDYVMIRGMRDAGIGIGEDDEEEIRASAVIVARMLTSTVDNFGPDGVPDELPAQLTRVVGSALMTDEAAIERAVATARAAFEQFSDSPAPIGEVGL